MNWRVFFLYVCKMGFKVNVPLCKRIFKAILYLWRAFSTHNPDVAYSKVYVHLQQYHLLLMDYDGEGMWCCKLDHFKMWITISKAQRPAISKYNCYGRYICQCCKSKRRTTLTASPFDLDFVNAFMPSIHEYDINTIWMKTKRMFAEEKGSYHHIMHHASTEMIMKPDENRLLYIPNL